MKRNAVTSAKASIEAVNSLMSANEEDRLLAINSLSLIQVEQYLSTIRVIQKDLKQKLAPSFLTQEIFTSAKYNPDLIFKVAHEGFTHSYSSKKDISEIKISPRPPFAQLKDLSIELNHRKAILENADREQNKIFRTLMMKSRNGQTIAHSGKSPVAEVKQEFSPSLSLDDTVSSVIEDAQEEFLYNTLDSYRQLNEQFQNLKENHIKTAVENKHIKEVMEQTIAQEALLKQDNEATRRQLAEAKTINEQFQNLQSSTLKENEQLKAQIFRLEQGLHLLGTISTPSESKTTPSELSSSSISKKEIFKFLKNNNCKSGSGIFSCSSVNDDSLINLQTLLKTKKAFTYAEIRECIMDTETRNVFDNPLKSNPSKLRNTAAVFRDIALHFATSILNVEPECSQPVISFGS